MYHVLFAPQSTRASWEFYGELTDAQGVPVDLTGCTMVFAANEKNGGGQRLLASTDNGKITFPDIGIFRWFFERGEMGGLCAGTYETGLTIANDTQTMQLSVGPLSITDGVVP